MYHQNKKWHNSPTVTAPAHTPWSKHTSQQISQLPDGTTHTRWWCSWWNGVQGYLELTTRSSNQPASILSLSLCYLKTQRIAVQLVAKIDLTRLLASSYKLILTQVFSFHSTQMRMEPTSFLGHTKTHQDVVEGHQRTMTHLGINTIRYINWERWKGAPLVPARLKKRIQVTLRSHHTWLATLTSEQ